MPNETEGRIDRLERALQAGLNVDLAEFDDPKQAKARAAQYEEDQKEQDKQLVKAAKQLEGPNDATGVPVKKKGRTLSKGTRGRGKVTARTATDTKGRESGVNVTAKPASGQTDNPGSRTTYVPAKGA